MYREAADSMGPSSLISTQPTPEKSYTCMYNIFYVQAFKFIQGHRNWYQSKAVCDFLLVCHYNYMPIFYRFRDITTCWLKICVFRRFYPLQFHFKPSQRSFPPRNYGMKVGVIKLESFGYLNWTPQDPTVISFEGIPACDRRTDGRTDTPPIARSRPSIAERDRNVNMETFLFPFSSVIITLLEAGCTTRHEYADEMLIFINVPATREHKLLSNLGLHEQLALRRSTHTSV